MAVVGHQVAVQLIAIGVAIILAGSAPLAISPSAPPQTPLPTQLIDVYDYLGQELYYPRLFLEMDPPMRSFEAIHNVISNEFVNFKEYPPAFFKCVRDPSDASFVAPSSSSIHHKHWRKLQNSEELARETYLLVIYSRPRKHTELGE